MDQEVLDLGVKNHDGGIKVSKSKVRVKKSLLKFGLGVKMIKLEKNTRKLRMRPRRW